jgi:ribonuclease HI
VDAALEKPVRQLMPEAEKLKAIYSNVIPEENANDLKDRAVNTALNAIIMRHPEIDNRMDSKKLVETIENRVAPVVKRVKKKREASRRAIDNHRLGR